MIFKVKTPMASTQKMNNRINPIIPIGRISLLISFLIHGMIIPDDVESIITYVPVTARHPISTAGRPKINAPGIGINDNTPINPTAPNQIIKLTTKKGIIKIFVNNASL